MLQYSFVYSLGQDVAMAKVSISEAARLAGVARSNFYTTYIKKGRISVSRDAQGRKFIDTTELIRVFPDINIEHQDSTANDRVGQDVAVSLGHTEQIIRNTELEIENKMLREQLKDIKDQRDFDRKQINNLSLKVIEYQSRRFWWQFWK